MSTYEGLEAQLRELPKVSLHDHMDGSLRPATLIELAAEVGHELPSSDPDQLQEIFRTNANSGDLVKYLETFAHTAAVMQSAENLKRIAREYVEDLAADGIVYAEIRWAPEQHTAGGLSLDEAVEAVQAGLAEGVEAVAAADGAIAVGQLISAMRQNDNAAEIVELALRHREKGVVGFDIAGPEAGFPPSKFAASFTRLAEQMLPATVHAGEADGIKSVRDALVHGRAQRLGHGIRVAEDITVTTGPDSRSKTGDGGEDLIEVQLGPVARWVRDRQIHLEASPTSNLHTGAVSALTGDAESGMDAHPFDMLYQLGFNIGVNTDNRLVSGVTLSGELAALAEAFDYSLAELADFQVNAIEASFLDYEDRQALTAAVLEAWNA
ncbi:adenosine deaminase [Nesterenkonia alkaliphila]|uniref:adenosine deaminase n=1 Tax=Nesterenkonia alkaliphila TaxID=1463631 RepID=A0A7K1UJF6_9MICC|nr:adenosine deaminase [Nesterenkonia alkaliphila]MVT26625.1 adenosine deaminase [Nesterenkonia alkaliphila]GFZ92246.1 adenosine deaminase 2 [Nesterenkonia alkaliphila]